MSERVRPAWSADLDAVAAIEASWPSAAGWSRAQFEAELGSTRALFLVAESGGEVAGYALGRKEPPELRLFTIAVAPQRAGRGLGRALLGAVIEAARDARLAKITLEVSSRNGPALRLYERAGGRVVGRRPKFYNDGSDALLMDLAL